MASKTTSSLTKSQTLPSLNFTNFKYIPKHLQTRQKKVYSNTNFVIKETPQEKIKRQEKQSFKPIKDLDLIMNKFNETLRSQKIIKRTPKKKNNDKIFQTQLEKRIETLLQLPTVKKIRKKVQQAQLQAKSLNQNGITLILTQAKRLQALACYERHIKESVSALGKEKRLNTTTK